MNHEDISIDNGAKANKFKFSSFFKLINSLKPHYSKLIIGTILGFIATAANLFVPQLAQRLIVNDTSQVKELLASTLPNAMTSILQFFGALIIMMAMDWQMTLLMFIGVPLIVLAVIPIMQKSRSIGRKRQDELANFSSDSTSVLSEIRLVKSSTGEKKELRDGNHRIDNLY